MLNHSRVLACVTALLAFMTIAANAQQSPILVIQEAGWANTGIQSTPPAALVVGTGACIGCSNFGQTNALSALTFYPSSHVQTVSITSSWGSSFTAYAGVFATGGEINWTLAQVLSNDGLVPANFSTSYQSNGGTVNLKPATVTSVQVILAPFTFQITSIGDWVAVGSNGLPPQMTIRVYGTY
jgi:hypothetical protein